MEEIEVGATTLFVLDDGTWRFPAHFFFANVPAAQWQARLDTDAEGKIPVGHNHGLVKTAHELIVIDTGYGDDRHGGCTGHLLDDFERTGLRPEQVTQVVTTHAHGDHIQRHTLLHAGRRRPTFTHARYHLARADWHWFTEVAPTPEVETHLVPLARSGQLTFFDGECEISPGVHLLPTPGHTPGHTSVLIESGGHCALFLGDLCHHAVHFSHPQWVSSFDTHPELTPHTRARIFSLAEHLRALLICPHLPAPGLGHLMRVGDGFVWQPLNRPARHG
ncbi:MBL fold metallo-hydrolase [Caldimonas brevitalea]|nr:MBL fold metallo-hydrolase [Caldimonas brevitalea]